MTLHVSSLRRKSSPVHIGALCLATMISLCSASPTAAATVGFSGTIAVASNPTLMPEKDSIVTFTDQVGIRFRSENASPEPIKLRLSIRNSAGQQIKPISISGNSIVRPKNENLITVVLPVARSGHEVIELCLKQVSKTKEVLSRSCRKLSVARLD